MDASEKYQKTSKGAASKCNAARATATRQYDRNLKPHNDAMKAAYGTPHYEAVSRAYTQAMIRLDNKCDAALAKAERDYALVMKQAWEECFMGKPAKTEQLSLWEGA